MIESLSGTLLEKAPGHAVVECHGVGYWVQLPASAYELLPAEGRPVRVQVHYAVTVDVRSGQSEHRLFGFINAQERALFRQLNGPYIKVQHAKHQREIHADARLLIGIPCNP